MKKIVFFTGAGISAESGIQTFRDSGGLWEEYKVDEICNIETWKNNKDKVFEFYQKRKEQSNNVEPNMIHKKIAEMQKFFKEFNVEVIVITQNIDNLLERAGCVNVLHVHGDLNSLQCVECNHSWNVEEIKKSFCHKCNKSDNVKPNVIFFGQDNALNYHLMKNKLNNLNPEDTLVVMGTLGNVVPIERYASVHSGFSILNNLEKSPYIRDYYFKRAIYDKGTKAIIEIERLLQEKYFLS